MGFGVLVSVFFLSGLCGLVYQVVWSRQMFLVFGSTTHAISTVIGIFMFGLALGSYLCGKVINRLPSLLRAYAVLEIGIGLFAFCFMYVLDAVDALHTLVFPLIYEKPLLLNSIRILLSALALIVPTTMMGATLPLLSQHLTRSPRHIGRDVGWLYFINTIGAAVGCFVSAFVLIPAIGLVSTINSGAVLNVLLGLLVLVLARRDVRSGPATARQDAAAAAALDSVTPEQARWVVWAFALSGFLALVFEVAWSRALILVFGSSVYSFSTMLTTFLVGIALGSMIVSRFIDRVRNPVLLYSVLTACMGLLVLLTTPAIGMLPDLAVRLYKPGTTSWASIELLNFSMSFVVMLPATLMSGGLFPVVSRVFMHRRKFEIGRTIGDVYAYNTIGGILGSLITGFLLVPFLGIERTLHYGGVACVLSAALLLLIAVPAAPLRKVTAAAAVVVVALLLPPLFPSWDTQVLNMGVYRNTGNFVQGLEATRAGGLAGLNQGIETIFYKEGHAATVAVTRDPQGLLVLRINGKADGSSGGDSYTQVLSGILPLLYVQDPKTALVIGLATGMTAGSTLSMPLERVDCIEISSEVVEASHFFDKVNNRPIEQPNFRLHVLDGRTWLMAMPQRYDVIVCEPSNPWQTGNANLFTQDFYRMARNRLTDQGVFCQWLPLYDVNDEQYRILLSTFKSAFPYTDLWMWMSDTILIGSNQPLHMDYLKLQQAMLLPGVKPVLDKLGIHTIPDLMSFFYLDNAGTNAFIAGNTRYNTDSFPIIEFSSPKNVHRLLAQDSLLYPLCRLSMKSRLPIAPEFDTPALREAMMQTRIRIYSNLGVPEDTVRGLFSTDG